MNRGFPFLALQSSSLILLFCFSWFSSHPLILLEISSLYFSPPLKISLSSEIELYPKLSFTLNTESSSIQGLQDFEFLQFHPTGIYIWSWMPNH
ncbi:uncharacterized protein LOC110682879 isoform X3 [Chenopodium quinoa]|uniref:uncharacterized protein LOC110682879 isoform X3 n=1 Tax=Chenopodium quinoa TaxID=63459 RepID=UPI000B79A5E3|nr:uncharacterized protein LOC110682879 isoform X3 [Chenopodium quinoa]